MLAALSMGMLGLHAADCPRDCPGTDSRGRPAPRRLPPLAVLTISTLLSAWIVAMMLAGCVTRTPTPPAGTPPGPAYQVSPSLFAASNAAVMLAPAVGTATGTDGAIPLAVTGIFGLIGAVSAAIARRKSAALDTVAAAVHQAGPDVIAQVLDQAAASTHFATVAQALNKTRPPRPVRPKTAVAP